MAVKIKNTKKKIRVNITVDKDSLEKAKLKLDLFGGKLSTLFNAYLNDFVSSMDAKLGGKQSELEKKLEELQKRLDKLEKK